MTPFCKQINAGWIKTLVPYAQPVLKARRTETPGRLCWKRL